MDSHPSTPSTPPHLHNLCKTDFSKAKSLPMLATTMQQCYHSANMLPMLTLLPYHIPHSILTPPLPSHLHNLCKTDFSKAKRLPMLADTVQHCYHSANVLLMLTALPTTYPIQFSPLHSLHTSTTFAKLNFQKLRVSQCWQPQCNTATTLPTCCQC